MNEQYMFPQYQPMGYRAMPTAPTIPAAAPQPQTGNGLIWVTGIEGAKSYLVAPNTTVMLMDSEGQRFYIKSSDQSGMPLPMRIFDYKEVREPQSGHVSSDSVNEDKYVTRKEFDELARRIAAMGGNADVE